MFYKGHRNLQWDPGGEGAGILMRSGGTVYRLLVTVHLKPGLKWLHRNDKTVRFQEKGTV